MKVKTMKISLLGAFNAVLLAASPAMAMTDAECTAAFTKADANNDGVITDAEGSIYFARHRVLERPIADGRLARDSFLTNCKSGAYDTAALDPGAPLAGANSFTENQAKDRIIAAGYADVSPLTKDDKGVWRGTAMKGDKKMSLAVDYKGNVVAS